MVSYLKSAVSYSTDKLGDGVIYVLDEMKFWGEVIVEFLELDSSSNDRKLQEIKQKVREQMEETEELDREVEALRREMDDNLTMEVIKD